MKTKQLLKQYWFVLVLAILAIVFVVFYAIDLQANAEKEVQTMQVDDQYVVYSIDGENYYADDLYNELYTLYGFNTAFRALDRMVIEQAVETTSEMDTTAANNAQYILSIYDQETLDSDLRSLGFNGIDELKDYYIYIQKSQELSKRYFTEHQAEYVDPYMEESPKSISHILIKVADVTEETDEEGNVTHTANPTEEETNKLNEVLEKLETEDFATVAYEYSDDSSASNGGSLGIVDEATLETYVAEFAEAVRNLKEGEISEVITTEYGYHIIKCDASTVETLLDDPNFISNLYNNNQNLYTEVIMETAQQLNITIENEDFKNELDSYLNESEETE